MTVGETHAPDGDHEHSARVIPFPLVNFEDETPEPSPLVFPKSKKFLATLKELQANTDTTGAQIMMYLYEELGLIPKKSK